MSGNVTKTPFGQTINAFTQRTIDENYNIQGQSLPCSVVAVDKNIVTVNFEVVQNSGFTIPQVTMPIAESLYAQMPVQVGDKGVAVSASVRLGGISGLGTGQAPLTPPSNLGALFFVPISNSEWTVDDTTAYRLRSANGNAKVTIGNSLITLSLGGTSITLDGTNVNINGTLIINGKAYLAHKHSGVKAGSDVSGGVA